jgi:vacuolar-type H+-ATPase subunit I/STV1
MGIFFFFLHKSKVKISSLKTEIENLNKTYSTIRDVETERLRIIAEIESLSTEKNKIKAEFLAKRSALTSEYENAHRIYEKLQKEINLLEESREMIEFGVYKPHFDFDTPDEFRHQLEMIRDKEKEMIRTERAVICNTQWSVEGSKAAGRKMTKQTHKLMLRAFNGECDAALAKVRWDNVLKMEERITKAFETINKSAEVNRSYISRGYLDLKITELRLMYEHQEKVKQARDEQRQIREQMRDEERAQREIERAREEAEKEEARYSKALEKALEEAARASGDQLNQLNEKVAYLQAQLKEAQELKERAISRAQLTKSGHVYIISNIGSFGENVYKIGMTRRLEPIERVKELGDASVPFAFDIHAMVYADNAPELENKIHRSFETFRINLVNSRREFFQVPLDEIEKWAKSENLNLHLTRIAEAREYRESVAIRTKNEKSISVSINQSIPESINGMFSEEASLG